MTLAAALLALAAGAAADAGSPALGHLDNLAQARAALSHPDHPLLVHFWALWCPPCLEELPQQGALAREARAAGADVLFINLDPVEDSARVLKQLAKARALDGPRHVQLSESLDPGAVTSLIDRDWDASIPATFALRPGGAVAARFVGAISPEARENLLRALRAPKDVQPAARR